MCSPARASPWRRLSALLLDYLVILGWMALLGAGSLAVYLVSGELPDVLGVLGVAGAQVTFFLLLTLPVGVYLFLAESGPWHATWGKRRLGLRVLTRDGGPPSRRQVAVRTVVKLLPWEIAHTFIWQMQAVFYSEGFDAPIPTWVLVGLNVVNVAVVVYLGMSLLGARRGPHDRAAGTAVTPAARPQPSAVSSA